MLLSAGNTALAAEQPFAACLDEFWHASPPALSAEGPLIALCASHFGTLYSGATETPLFSAEHLTPKQIEAAIRMPRDNNFHQDNRLPYAIASTLEDYRGSGYDRGHMAPSGDEPDATSQYESFTLSNMVPQNSNDNRFLWAEIETAVRELVLAGGDEVYVVTGPMFDAQAPRLQGRVEVPAYIYKAVYDATAGFAGVYVAPNAPGWTFWELSIADFKRRSGIDPFPNLSAALTSDGSRLPPPMHARHTQP
jgi:endonuclease G